MFSFFSFSSPVIALVLAVLVIFSIVSWAIIVLKLLQIRAVRLASQTFLDFFWKTRDIATVDPQLEQFSECPPLALFREGVRETQYFLELRPTHDETLSVALGALENISRSLRKVSTVEIEKLEKDLSFLATTAATTPFIGLFGTVWGIMQAFQNIGQAGSTSLAIVAPGISEALITTAIGLAVAIPAVIGFNFLQNKIRRLTNEIDNFCADFLNVVQRVLAGPKKE